MQVLVGDVCPNIPGLQPTVPSGMIIDENGDCITPAPPPPPDACPNIGGYQAAIPDGYYRNQAGDCVPQTTPPKDVCPNLSGTQSSVPRGMSTASNGDCVWPPNDSCVNIPGPQDGMPSGMEYDVSGNCVTPIASSPPKPGSSMPQNTPDALKPVVTSVFNLIPDWLKNIFRNFSPTLARTLPYYLIAVLIVISLQFFWQTIREALAVKWIIAIFKRKKRLAEEKDRFIVLSAQYLRGALDSMLANLDSLVPQKGVPEETAQLLVDAAKALRADIETVLVSAETNRKLESTNAPNHAGIHVKTLTSPLFWVPIVIIGTLILGMNFMFSVVGGINLGTGNLWIQFLIYIAACASLYLALRSRHVRHIEHENAQKLVGNEYTIDTTRNNFIQQSSASLASGLKELDKHRSVIADAPSGVPFNNEYEGLTHILAIFTLLGSVQTETSDITKLNIRDVLDACLLGRQTAFDIKKMTITDTAKRHELQQNRRLLSFVLGSAIDYAVRFSNVGGNISIDTVPVSHGLEIRIGNNSAGIPQEKLAALFKPTQSDIDSISGYEELGLSLFLDKIIMNYLDGDIAATSESGKGTTIAVRV